MEQHSSIDLEVDGENDSFEASPFRGRCNTWPTLPPRVDQFGGGGGQDDLDGLELGGGLGLGFGLDNTSSANLSTIGETGSSLALNDNPVIPTTANSANLLHHDTSGLLDGSGGQAGGPKKNTSRRNAWGNMSYADLITQAIQSSPDKRLTLSQIYDWMVQNVPYFKDKGDSNSSAGWKNSIRHNLSLHNRFMRVQNEGTGKSSWWMINPDAKPGKAARRRATSMETQKYEKKRGRVKKKVEAMRNGLSSLEANSLQNVNTGNNTGGGNTSPSSSISEGLDIFPESPLHHTFQLSPDFRPRASSNASSCGRLSPIPAVESDMHDSQVPPLSPMSGWGSDVRGLYPSELSGGDGAYNEHHLVDMANSLKLNSQYSAVSKSSPGQLSPASSLATLGNASQSIFTSMSYPDGSAVPNYSGGGGMTRNGSDPYFQQAGLESNITLTTLNSLNVGRSPSRASSLLSNTGSDGFSVTPHTAFSLSPAQSMDTLVNSQPVTPQSNSSNNYNHSPQHHQQQQNQANIKSNAAQNRGVYGTNGGFDLLRAVQAKHQGQDRDRDSGLSSTGAQVMIAGHLLSLNGHPNNHTNTMPNDLDFASLEPGLECDVDQVIRHELSVDGQLDFNFDQSSQSNGHHSNTPQSVGVSSSMSTMSSTHSWVH